MGGGTCSCIISMMLFSLLNGSGGGKVCVLWHILSVSRDLGFVEEELRRAHTLGQWDSIQTCTLIMNLVPCVSCVQLQCS